MKSYQTKGTEVKNSVAIVDVELIEQMACKGLLSLSIKVGLEVMAQLFEAEVTARAGEKGRHCKDRDAYRHGTEQTKIVLGGEKVAAERPRMRAADGSGEIPLETLAFFQRGDQLNEQVLSRLLAGVSCRKYGQALGLGLEGAACTSKSEVARRFAFGMQALMDEFFGRRIEGSFPAIMLDGMEFGDVTVVAAMGIRSDGKKLMLGLTEGGSENSEVVKRLLADLIERGLDPSEPRLCVLDGGKALAKAVKDTFGKNAVIQRCQVHKKRNVLAHLPESEKANAGRRISAAYMEFDYDEAKRRLELLAREIGMRYPSASASLLEGLEETLSVHKLEVPGLLRQTLASTNAIESANSVCAGIVRRVTNFKDGETAVRHAAAGFLEAERCFRRVKGYRQIPVLQAALAKLTGAVSEDKMGVA